MASFTMEKGNPHVVFVDPAEHESMVRGTEAQIRDHILNLGNGGDVSEVPKPSS